MHFVGAWLALTHSMKESTKVQTRLHFCTVFIRCGQVCWVILFVNGLTLWRVQRSLLPGSRRLINMQFWNWRLGFVVCLGKSFKALRTMCGLQCCFHFQEDVTSSLDKDVKDLNKTWKVFTFRCRSKINLWDEGDQRRKLSAEEITERFWIVLESLLKFVHCNVEETSFKKKVDRKMITDQKMKAGRNMTKKNRTEEKQHQIDVYLPFHSNLKIRERKHYCWP